MYKRQCIGTTNPAQTLDITSANPVIRLTDTDPAGVYSQIDGAGGDLIIAADGGAGSSNSFISFRVDGTALSAEMARMRSDGKFVIGDTNSDALLGVVRSSYNIAEFCNNNADATGAEVALRKDSSSPADGDTLGILKYIGDNDAGEKLSFAYITSKAVDVTDGTEDGRIEFHTRGNGTITERLRINEVGDLLLGNHGSRIFDDSSGTNVVVDIYGGTTAGKRGILALGGRTGSDDADIGTIQFVNENNNLATAPNHVQSKLVASIDVKSETSDGNAGSDSGAHLLFSTKPETGAIAERLRIRSNGNVVINNSTGSILEMTRTSTNTSGLCGKVVFGNTDWDSSMASIQSYQDGGNDNASLRFYTQASAGAGELERIRITSGGKIGVNYAGTPPSETMMISSTDSTTGLSVSHLSGGNRYGFRLSTLGGTNNGLIVSRFTNSTYTEALRINANGDVTTTGQASFDRQNAGFTARAGDAVSITRASGTPLEINRTGSDGQMISLMDDNTQEAAIAISSGALQFGTPNSNNPRLAITSGGTVNIGGDYTNTTGKLKVTGVVTVDGGFNLTAGTLTAPGGFSISSGNVIIHQYIAHDADSDSFFGFPGGNRFKLELGGKKTLEVRADGNVGFGTDNPQNDFEIYGHSSAASGAAPVFQIRNGYSGTADSGNALKSEIRFCLLYTSPSPRDS